MYKIDSLKLIAGKTQKCPTYHKRIMIQDSRIETGDRCFFLNTWNLGFLAMHEYEGYHGNPPMLLVRERKIVFPNT